MNQRLGFAALAAIACGALRAGTPAQLTVTPESGLIDAPFHVQLRNVLPNGARVTLSASRPDARGRTWTAVGEYAADASGRVDVDVAPSLGGSYEGVSPHGLWCSALPVAPDKLTTYIAELPSHPEMGTAPELDVTGEYRVALSASIDGKPVASATAVRSYGPPAATQDVTAAGGVRAVLYLRLPALPRRCRWWCSRARAVGCRAGCALAAHGHPALAQDFRLGPAVALRA
jgi:hypothetical protein